MRKPANLYHQVPHLQKQQAAFFQPKLKINQPDDIYEQEADEVAEKVIQQKPVSIQETFFKPAPVNLKLIQRDDKEPDPAGEGISTVGKQLGENNPAFSKLAEQLGDQFLAQPAELSIGLPAFLIGNYAFLWSSVFWSRNMRTHLNEFNLGTIPGIIPHFPFKTFTYSIQDEAQTQFKFDFGLDASKLISLFNEDVFNTHISRFSFDTSGDLNTATPSLDISKLQINLGLFNGGFELSGGFRDGVSQYPVFDKDDITGNNYRIMQQVPGLPDLMQDRRDIRFNVLVDVLKLYDYFAPERKPFENVPIGMSPTDLNMVDTGVQRKCAGCEKEEKENQLQRKTNDTSEPEVHSGFENYVEGLNQSGQKLPDTERAFFENSMGYDFSAVRIHNDSLAAKSAQSINALAYTSGNNIVFNEKQYQPATTQGKKLLAHELTHVVQQSKSVQPKLIQRQPAGPGVCDADQMTSIGTMFHAPETEVAKKKLKEKMVAVNIDEKTDDVYLHCPHRSTVKLKKLVPGSKIFFIRNRPDVGLDEAWVYVEGEKEMYWGFISSGIYAYVPPPSATPPPQPPKPTVDYIPFQFDYSSIPSLPSDTDKKYGDVQFKDTYVLISDMPDQIVKGSEVHYALRSKDVALPFYMPGYEWRWVVSDANGAVLDETTTNLDETIIEFNYPPGDYSLSASLLKDGNTLYMIQDHKTIVDQNQTLTEDLKYQEKDFIDAYKELVNDFKDFVIEGANSTGSNGISPRFLAAVLLREIANRPKHALLGRTFEIDDTMPVYQNMEMTKSGTAPDRSLGVGQIKASTIAMVRGDTPWINRRQSGDPEDNWDNLSIDKRISIFEELRWPKSNIKMAAELLAKLKNRSNRYPTLTREDFNDNSRAMEIIATEYNMGPTNSAEADAGPSSYGTDVRADFTNSLVLKDFFPL